MARRLFRPFGQFEAGAGKDVAKACVFPFARITEAVEVEVPDVQNAVRARKLVRLHHRIGRALDPPRNAQCMQQVAHEGRLARAQLAMQLDERMTQRWQGGQTQREGLGVGLRSPYTAPHSASYNRQVTLNSVQLISSIQTWARELGFSQIGVAGIDMASAEAGLMQWLDKGFHGDMAYMAAHGLKRARPAELVPGTVSVITARMDYLPRTTPDDWQSMEFKRLERPQEGIVSVYARGRDYHKVLRSRLQKLSGRIEEEIGPFGHRVFTDSAPVLEAELAARSGQGWRGKHTLVLNREAGSMFFLGEIYVDVALPASEALSSHCGSCTACIEVCPTRAILKPGVLDSRRCISYLTIEHAGSIPEELRPLIGNRIYGCDDCQLICPWNKFAQRSGLPDFDERAGLSGQQLSTLFSWSEQDFLRMTEGSPIRRIGHARWLRNVAVAMGNALRKSPQDESAGDLRHALGLHAGHADAVVREHVGWALAQSA
jgi:epoxyqueuosine reductase